MHPKCAVRYEVSSLQGHEGHRLVPGSPGVPWDQTC